MCVCVCVSVVWSAKVTWHVRARVREFQICSCGPHPFWRLRSKPTFNGGNGGGSLLVSLASSSSGVIITAITGRENVTFRWTGHLSGAVSSQAGTAGPVVMAPPSRLIMMALQDDSDLCTQWSSAWSSFSPARAALVGSFSC